MYRRLSLVFLTLIAAITLFLTPAFAAKSFPETGFSITNDKLQDYFDHRGGVRVFGYPISREFDFLGTKVQFFQRAVLQLQPNGGVALLNVLDEGLLPYTQINGSSFPGPDSSVFGLSPNPADPNYATKALDFIRNYAPDSFQGMPTNFYSTFMNTVSLSDAFPNGGGEPGLLPLINLEIWGLPTSKPTLDPKNNDFVYIRFQRGIMHFDKATGLTQGILIGDYLKSVITGQNLPTDLEQQARSSRLYRQYTNATVSGLARPNDLPATTIFASFEKDGVVIPTPLPQPTATPVPPGPTSTPTPMPTPGAIAYSGSGWFMEQTKLALDKLSDNAPQAYGSVRQYVYRIEESTGATSSIDFPNRTLKVREADAFPIEWRFSRDNQAEWYAGWVVHMATHIEQAAAGRSTSSFDAEREARMRQKDALALIETTQPGQQFTQFVLDVLNFKENNFNEWEAPREPSPTPTPTRETT